MKNKKNTKKNKPKTIQLSTINYAITFIDAMLFIDLFTTKQYKH